MPLNNKPTKQPQRWFKKMKTIATIVFPLSWQWPELLIVLDYKSLRSICTHWIHNIYFPLCLKKYCNKWTTLVENDPKAPFSIATTPRSQEDATPSPGLLHFTLDPYLIMPSAKQSGIKSLVWLDLGLNLGHSDRWQDCTINILKTEKTKTKFKVLSHLKK